MATQDQRAPHAMATQDQPDNQHTTIKQFADQHHEGVLIGEYVGFNPDTEHPKFHVRKNVFDRVICELAKNAKTLNGKKNVETALHNSNEKAVKTLFKQGVLPWAFGDRVESHNNITSTPEIHYFFDAAHTVTQRDMGRDEVIEKKKHVKQKLNNSHPREYANPQEKTRLHWSRGALAWFLDEWEGYPPETDTQIR